MEVNPNPVAAGDTAVFTCIVEDSLNPRLQYEWDLDGGSIPFPTTDTNQYHWEAPSDTGRYRHRVEVDDPDRDVFSVQQSFEVLVTDDGPSIKPRGSEPNAEYARPAGSLWKR